MTDNVRQIVGITFVVLGILDPLLGIFVVAPRMPDENKRQVLKLALLASGALLITLGALLLAGVLGK